MLGEQLVVVGGEALEQRLVARVAGVADRDEGVAPQPPRVVARDEEAVVAGHQLPSVALEPGAQIDMAGVGRGQMLAPFLDAAVPRTDVLADVAAVDL